LLKDLPSARLRFINFFAVAAEIVIVIRL